MQLPSKFIARAVGFKSQEFSSSISTSNGGRSIISKTPGHKYYFTIETPFLDLDELKDLASWRDEHACSSSSVFTAKIPLLSEGRGSAFATPGAPVARATALKGAKVVLMEGFPANATNIIRPFDMVTWASHTKLYAAATTQTGDQLDASPFNTNGLGETTIKLTKELLEDVPIGTALNLGAALITARPVGNTWGFKIDVSNSKYTRLTLDCVEHY
jgi:hypothetical protein